MRISLSSSSDDDNDDALGRHWPFWEDGSLEQEEEEDNSMVVVPPPESTLSTNTNNRGSAPNLVNLPLESQPPPTGRSSHTTTGNSNAIDNDNDGTQKAPSTTPSHGPAAAVNAATTSSIQAVYHKRVEYVSTNTTAAIGAVVKHWNLYSAMALVLALLIVSTASSVSSMHSRGRGHDGERWFAVLDMATRSPLRIERATTTALVRDDWADQAVAAATTMTPFASFPHPILLSTPELCTVTADTVGDEGDPSVVLIESGNSDDSDADMSRWGVSYQGDLDWKGKLPNGVVEPSHWIQLDFIEPVLLTRVVLDWGACYTDHYDLQIRTSALSPWKTIVKSKDYPIVLHSWGQSTSVPGAALHNEDDVIIPAHAFASGLATSLRVFVHDTAHKNGCLSLWHIQVMGYDSVNQERPLVHTELTGGGPLSSSSVADDSDDFAMTASPNFIPPALAARTNHAAVGATRSWFGSSWRRSSSSSRSGDDSYQHFWHVCSNDSFGGGAWLRLDFPTDMLVTKVVLDWTAGYAGDYTVAVGSDAKGWQTIGHFDVNRSSSRDGAQADSSSASDSSGAFTVEALGTFPTSTLSTSCMETGHENTMADVGVALHQYTHTLNEPLAQNVPTRHLRVWIHKLATAATTAAAVANDDDVTPTLAALAVWKVRVFGYKV